MEKKKTTFIYTILHPITEEVRYIGKSNTLRKRLSTHIQKRNKTKSHKNNWIKSLLKEGLRPIIKVLDEVPMDEWEFWEIYWIGQFRQWGFRLTNHSDGGMGPNGVKRSKKAKKKMRNAKLGISLSEETKKRMSESGKDYHKENPSYNMKGRNERIPIDRDLLYKLYITENSSLPKISKKLGYSQDKIYQELKVYGIKKEDGWWLEGLSKQYKKVVLQYDLNGNLLREWDGVVDITNEFGFDKGNISGCCRGGVKTANGFIWRYKDEWIDLPDLNKSKVNTNIPVNMLDLGGNLIKSYDTIKEAAKENGLRSTNIRKCCDKKSKTYKGYIWEY